jgi:hypothetical protein
MTRCDRTARRAVCAWRVCADCRRANDPVPNQRRQGFRSSSILPSSTVTQRRCAAEPLRVTRFSGRRRCNLRPRIGPGRQACQRSEPAHDVGEARERHLRVAPVGRHRRQMEVGRRRRSCGPPGDRPGPWRAFSGSAPSRPAMRCVDAGKEGQIRLREQLWSRSPQVISSTL